jgi:hypothetical protein
MKFCRIKKNSHNIVRWEVFSLCFNLIPTIFFVCTFVSVKGHMKNGENFNDSGAEKFHSCNTKINWVKALFQQNKGGNIWSAPENVLLYVVHEVLILFINELLRMMLLALRIIIENFLFCRQVSHVMKKSHKKFHFNNSFYKWKWKK